MWKVFGCLGAVLLFWGGIGDLAGAERRSSRNSKRQKQQRQQSDKQKKARQKVEQNDSRDSKKSQRKKLIIKKDSDWQRPEGTIACLEKQIENRGLFGFGSHCSSLQRLMLIDNRKWVDFQTLRQLNIKI